MTTGGRHQPQGIKIAYHTWGMGKLEHGPGVSRISASRDGTKLDEVEAWKLLEDHVQRVYFDLDNSDDCASCTRFMWETPTVINGRMHQLMGWDVYSIMARDEEEAPFPEEKTPGSVELWKERMARYRQAWEARKK